MEQCWTVRQCSYLVYMRGPDLVLPAALNLFIMDDGILIMVQLVEMVILCGTPPSVMGSVDSGSGGEALEIWKTVSYHSLSSKSESAL